MCIHHTHLVEGAIETASFKGKIFSKKIMEKLSETRFIKSGHGNTLIHLYIVSQGKNRLGLLNNCLRMNFVEGMNVTS